MNRPCHPHARTALGPHHKLKAVTKGLGAFANAGHAKVAQGVKALHLAAAVVGHFKAHASAVNAQCKLNALGAGLAQRVGQGLLQVR